MQLSEIPLQLGDPGMGYPELLVAGVAHQPRELVEGRRLTLALGRELLPFTSAASATV